MDEVQVGESQSSPEVSNEASVQSNEVVTEQATQEAAPVQEKMLPQSQVNKIVAREAKQAAEKARREAQMEYEKLQTHKAVEEQQQSASQMGGIPQMTPQQIEQHIMQAAHRMSTQMTADKMAKDFESKIQAEIESDPDFGDVYDSMNIAAHPELVIWMNGMDNSAKVVKELGHNPAKFAHILMLAKSGMPQLAQKELGKIHDSIKTNQAALNQPKSKEPLDQLSPSSIGRDNGENLSVSDYGKMDWLRG